MFQTLLDLRLLIVDSLNTVTDDEQAATADSWVRILELEATRLSDGDAAWLPAGAGTATILRRKHVQQWARMLGQADARLSLIVADQAVAALIRGHIAEVVS